MMTFRGAFPPIELRALWYVYTAPPCPWLPGTGPRSVSGILPSLLYRVILFRSRSSISYQIRFRFCNPFKLPQLYFTSRYNSGQFTPSIGRFEASQNQGMSRSRKWRKIEKGSSRQARVARRRLARSFVEQYDIITCLTVEGSAKNGSPGRSCEVCCCCVEVVSCCPCTGDSAFGLYCRQKEVSSCGKLGTSI